MALRASAARGPLAGDGYGLSSSSCRFSSTVVDSGGFARAAEALRMGRPSVTNAVSALEAAIGARLLHRTTRRSRLTGEGELFYERATRILADVGRPGTCSAVRAAPERPAARRHSRGARQAVHHSTTARVHSAVSGRRHRPWRQRSAGRSSGGGCGLRPAAGRALRQQHDQPRRRPGPA